SNFSFPAVKVSKLILTLSYKQTLQLTEVSVNQADASQTQSYSVVRFLAKPASSYFLYTDATTHQRPSVKNQEAGNLFSVQSVRKMMLPAPELNPAFIPADSDADGILDSVDNCPTVANPDQIDKNYNGVGDVCDDFDYDTIPNNRDNCPDVANTQQADTDGDGIGDACDSVESRLTEQSPWLPWAAMSIAALIIGGLFYAVATSNTLVPPKTEA
ncbi:thrombospondin type 3 repeat-containing protein, partial [Candidatus Woesebacteria bacterium]|nr:thrombospondin type 3 repeat-containing protein [Candidatus Woesebacteria bacterium]